ncbi:tetratricopeptide repeat protein [Sphingorhabdus arenilitoris]|uniref:Tetratricopeptide repeat protein n=1 Tax=Sphingorhabdus arenilitoris TaxID=1490041 RepID=A0ABV8RCW0_9SPHN
MSSSQRSSERPADDGQGAPSEAALHFAQLLGFLELDPENIPLLKDAIAAALSVSDFDNFDLLLSRHNKLAEPTNPIRNLEGIAALRRQRFDEAISIFERLRSDGEDVPAVRFNLAWIAALQMRHEDVLSLTDEAVIAGIPRAAALRVQALHHLGQFDEALAAGQKMAEIHPHDNYLLGAMSVAAMDVDDYELAKYYASKATGGSDALTTQGLVSLYENGALEANGLFDRALAEHPDAPRAWLGKGLCFLAEGDVDAAIPCLQKGAEIFEDHLGSWIALGWTHFIRKDLAEARKSFDIALSHDDNFAETHGGLAVLDVAEGHLDSAKRRAEIAIRLDRQCFGGMLANVMLAEARGNPELAKKIADRAMNTSMGVDGKTLAEAMIGLGVKGDARH